MDSNSEDGEYQHLRQDAAQYRVTYPHGRNTKDVDYDKNEEFNKKRYPVSRSGNNPGRVKRVVSCKRKTHHLTVTRRKQLGTGKTYDAANKENEINCMQDVQQEIFDMDPWEFPLNVNNNHKTGKTGLEQADYCALTELTRDHSTMTNVLFGRHLRLKVSLTLWQRNIGELLTYFLRIQDIGVFVDFLPLISKSIDENSPRITIGCCVDLFPLVKKVLTKPYEEYLIVGLKWINSVLKKWWEELRTSGYSGSTESPMDNYLHNPACLLAGMGRDGLGARRFAGELMEWRVKLFEDSLVHYSLYTGLLDVRNFQAFNQQLLELWYQEPLLKSVPGTAGDMAKVIDSFLSQLT